MRTPIMFSHQGFLVLVERLSCVTYVLIYMYMQDTIARARITEAFMNASATAGLSDNLEHLAKLVDEDDEDEGTIA